MLSCVLFPFLLFKLCVIRSLFPLAHRLLSTPHHACNTHSPHSVFQLRKEIIDTHSHTHARLVNIMCGCTRSVLLYWLSANPFTRTQLSGSSQAKTFCFARPTTGRKKGQTAQCERRAIEATNPPPTIRPHFSHRAQTEHNTDGNAPETRAPFANLYL